MKVAVSITLLLAVVSASAVGIGYLVRRQGQAAAPATPAGTTAPTTTPPVSTLPAPAPSIAAGEPYPGLPSPGATFGDLGMASGGLGSWLDSITASLPVAGSVLQPGPITVRA